MFVPGIKNHGKAFSDGDGFEYNYLMQYENRRDAEKEAHRWATEKTPAQARNVGDIIAYTVKEWNGE